MRHGTIDLFAALNLVNGMVIHQLTARHRAVEFRKFLDQADFLVAFSELERTVGGKASRAQVCHVTRWDGDRIAEYWSMRHATP